MSEPATESIPSGVWYFSGDLLFASRVSAAAEQSGLVFSLLSRWPEQPPSAPRWIIVDLATKSGASAEIYQQSKSHYPDVPCIAFGAHVQAARLSQARQVGFDPVLTRGQFDSALPTIFEAR
jgi:CheY-like chemotaxis protein